MIKVTDKKGLQDLLQSLSENYSLAAPVIIQKGSSEKIEYEYIEDPSQMELSEQPDTSPKAFFLPQDEVLGSEPEGKARLEGEKTILFGVRSCDIEAIRVLDSVFLHDENFVDPYYKNRRENTIIFGYSCDHRQKSCFCDQVNVDPVENDNVPVYVYENEGKYWFKVFDEQYQELLQDLPDGDEGELQAVIDKNREQFNDSKFELDIPVPLPEEETFSAPVWDEIAAKCLGCGVCTFYCPTCFCFGFYWEDGEEQVEKYREWDSCMFSLFTKHASGHNPRETQSQRWRQRLMHKFSYHPQNYDGQLACVGCGRCIDRCPVTLDIREALKITEGYLQEGGTE